MKMTNMTKTNRTLFSKQIVHYFQCSFKGGELEQNICFTDLTIREGGFIGMTSEGSPESEDLAQ